MVRNLIAPWLSSFTVTEFATGACPAEKLRFEVFGRGFSAGHTVRNPSVVGSTAVTFKTTAVAPDEITQLPLLPRTNATKGVSLTIGTFRLPTVLSPGRVSNKRQGTIGTKTLRTIASGAAIARCKPPNPNVTASAAPTAAHLDRTSQREGCVCLIERSLRDVLIVVVVILVVANDVSDDVHRRRRCVELDGTEIVDLHRHGIRDGRLSCGEVDVGRVGPIA